MGSFLLGYQNISMPFRIDLYNPLIIVPSINCSALNCTGPRFNHTYSKTFQNISNSVMTYKQVPVYSKTSSLTTYGWIGNDTVTFEGLRMTGYRFMLA